MKRNLKTIEMFHYVYGGIICFSGLIMLVLVGMGALIGRADLEVEGDVSREWVAAFLGALGWVLFVFIEMVGAFNIYSGYCIGRRRHRTFSMVVAAFDCLSIPLGLLLGVFTLIALNDEEVKAEYQGIVPIP